MHVLWMEWKTCRAEVAGNTNSVILELYEAKLKDEMPSSET